MITVQTEPFDMMKSDFTGFPEEKSSRKTMETDVRGLVDISFIN